MASDQTANLGLNQWAADDPVLRADFNADNQKLDASLTRVRLRTVTTGADAYQVDVDVSDIDWTKYLYVDVAVELHAAASSAGTYFFMRLNGASAADAYYARAWSSTSTSGSSAIGSFSYQSEYRISGEAYLGRGHVRLYCGGGTMIASRLCEYCSSGVYDIGTYVSCTSRGSGVTGRNVTALNFMAGNAADRILAGSKIYLQGVLK